MTVSRCPSCGASSRWWSSAHARSCELWVDPRLDAPLVTVVLGGGP
jgi:hypothetical protein